MRIFGYLILMGIMPTAETTPLKALEGPAVCTLPPGHSDLADLVAGAYEGLTGRTPMNVQAQKNIAFIKICKRKYWILANF